MKLRVQDSAVNVRKLITNLYDDYNIINNSQVDHDTYFIVIERYFFRTGNRASLSIVISSEDEFRSIIEAVGSGGGQGMIFKFDWGVKESFEGRIPTHLQQHNIPFERIN